MYTILIADDEKWIRAGLIQTVDWENYGFDRILEASDGQSALEIALAEKPDAIIADIKMPKMTGIEMTERLRMSGNDVYVILISGFGEFVYAQRAIECGVREYILKPVDTARLEEALLKCREFLDEKSAAYGKDENEKYSHYLLIAQRHYMRELLLSDTRSLSASQLSTMADLGLECNGKKLILTVIRFPQTKISGESIITELMKLPIKETNCIFPGRDSNEICIIMISQDEEQLISSAAAVVQNMANRDIGLISSYGTAETSDHFGTSYDNAVKYCDYRFFTSGRKSGGSQSHILETKYALPSYSQLLNFILSENYDAVRKHIHQSFSVLPEQVNQKNAASVRRSLLEKLERVFSECLARGLFSKDDLAYIKLKELPRQLSLIDTEVLLNEIISALENRDEMSRSSSGQLAQSAIAYVKEHFRENISMNTVAKRLCVNPSYFSHVFSEQVKIPFTKYLNSYRITVAKQLLLDPTIKIYEVAHLVGFDDYRYFSKIFKDQEGIPPDQYRNLLTDD